MYVSLQKIKRHRIMKELFFNTIQEFNDFIGVKTLHPLVSIARVENTSPIQETVFAEAVWHVRSWASMSSLYCSFL